MIKPMKLAIVPKHVGTQEPNPLTVSVYEDGIMMECGSESIMFTIEEWQEIKSAVEQLIEATK